MNMIDNDTLKLEIQKLAKYHLLHLAVFSITLFIWTDVIKILYTCGGDSGMSVVGFFMYLPYVLLLVLYDFIFISIGLLIFPKVNRIILYILPIIPVVIWFFISAQRIQICYYELRIHDFGVLITLWLIVNILMYYRMKWSKRKEAV